MPVLIIKVKDKIFDTYYADLEQLSAHQAHHEQATRRAFGNLLDHFAKKAGWTLILEQRMPNGCIPDGTLRDLYLPHGYWEAKDTKDDLRAEIKRKTSKGYPTKNIVYEDTQRAILIQNGKEVGEYNLHRREELVNLLSAFLNFEEPNYQNFYVAVREFGEQIPTLALRLKEIIANERKANRKFIAAFEAFQTLCKTSLNPAISADTIEEMLVQHLMTERLFRTIFDNPDFVQRNVIANEIEKVIRALASRVFNRSDLLKRLDPFYDGIEGAARGLTDWSEKQSFLNTIYERFFKDFSQKQADTFGIVYTPQEIVDFMCASVDEVLKREFGKQNGLSSEGVVILDPCTGTGNFMVNMLRRIRPPDLKRKYASELFANEIMLLPYYIASLNIEHEYYRRTGEYASFEGMCFADTLDLAEGQLPLFAEENTERIKRQKDAPITVVIGNPPYNVGQHNENDNNKNRKYAVIDQRVRETYAKDSHATNKNALSDPYVKFVRWAADRLQERDGIVCLVTNNSFIDQIAFDGMRKHLQRDFDAIYHIDLHGNVRQNPKLSGTAHNVFGIQVGVGISLFVRRRVKLETTTTEDSHLDVKAMAQLFYQRVAENWRRGEKLDYLATHNNIYGVDWRTPTPDANNHWLTEGISADFAKYVSLGNKEAKATTGSVEPHTIFKNYGRGVATSRDDWAYDFDKNRLAEKIQRFSDIYNTEVDRWKRHTNKSISIDDFVTYDDTKIKWSRDLKLDLNREHYLVVVDSKFRKSIYRPFTSRYLFFDRILNEEVYQQPSVFPNQLSETENHSICVSGIGHRVPFTALITTFIPNLALNSIDGFQCFPLYTYDEDGSNRRDNITNWALAEFQKHISNSAVTKSDLFHYIYAILHHPLYRTRYAENLKRELPHIPFPHQLTLATTCPHLNEAIAHLIRIGKALAHAHIHYEQADQYMLTEIISNDVPFTWRVEQMKLSKDKTTLTINESLTLTNLPSAIYDYRLGNRSALEWVIDQYQVSTDKRSGLVTDPNRLDDEAYIVRLVKQVITVSLQTVSLVNEINQLITGFVV